MAPECRLPKGGKSSWCPFSCEPSLGNIREQVTTMSLESNAENLIGPDSEHFALEGDGVGLAAWTEIEAGRFMPRRVRGSCQGRALG